MHDFYCRKITKIINRKERNLGADFTKFTILPRVLPLDFSDPVTTNKKSFTF